MEYYDIDDFFATGAGVEVLVPIGSRQVPITVKRVVGMDIKESAKAQAMKVVFLPNGQPKVLGMDEKVFQTELLFSTILSWPFTQKKKDEQGRILMDEQGEPLREPVPVTRENIRLLVAEGTEYLVQKVLGLLEKKVSPQTSSASPSDAASSPMEAPTL